MAHLWVLGVVVGLLKWSGVWLVVGRSLRVTRCLAGLVALVAAAPGVVWGQTFLSLGVNGPAGTAQAYAISEDGTTVVGQTGSNRAFRWRVSSGLIPLGDAPLSGYTLRRATDVSADGEVVVGIMSDGIGTRVWRNIATNSPSLVSGLGGSPNPRVSGDGSTVVGNSTVLQEYRAVRWTQAGGVVDIGTMNGLPSGYAASTNFGLGVSSDGSVVVGTGFLQTGPPNNENGQSQVYRWTADAAAQATLNAGSVFANAVVTDVSADGSTMVVRRTANLYRWTLAGGYQLIRLGGSNLNEAPRISADASTVVDANVVWTQATGPRSLETVLAEAGCNFTGWSGLRVTDVSGNGRALCGYGVNPLGQTEAWYATVPAPGGVVGFVVVGGVMGGRRRVRAWSAFVRERTDRLLPADCDFSR